eukprot:scaffold28856_cov46-Cyclotella_meneghiniana.AAC.1
MSSFTLIICIRLRASGVSSGGFAQVRRPVVRWALFEKFRWDLDENPNMIALTRDRLAEV